MPATQNTDHRSDVKTEKAKKKKKKDGGHVSLSGRKTAGLMG